MSCRVFPVMRRGSVRSVPPCTTRCPTPARLSRSTPCSESPSSTAFRAAVWSGRSSACVSSPRRSREEPPMPSATPERRWFRAVSKSVSLIEDDPAFRTRSVSRKTLPSHQASQQAQTGEDHEQDEGEFLEILRIGGGEASPPDPEAQCHEGRHRSENDEAPGAQEARPPERRQRDEADKRQVDDQRGAEHRGRNGLAGHEDGDREAAGRRRSEEHTSELQSLRRISYAVFCLKKKKTTQTILNITLDNVSSAESK